MNIMLWGDYFLSWTGGANLLGYIARSLNQACEVTGDKLYFAVGSHFLADPLAQERVFTCIQRPTIIPTGPFQTFFSECNNIQEIYFVSNIPEFIKQNNIEILGPSGRSPGSIDCPWVGYIPDFQHEYLPLFFSADERASRDLHFRKLVEESAAIYVNSQSVSNDVRQFFPGYFPPKKIFRFPRLSANVQPSQYSHLVKEKFGIKRDYFISCSQRWIHKQHDLIIESFKKFCDRNAESDLDLIFTGSVHDYRSSEYNDSILKKIEKLNLADRVKSLGLVDRQDQLDLIFHSKGLVQASLFEGGPGASGMQEAAMLSKVIVASDIMPNFEFNQGCVLYFKCRDAEDLYSRLVQANSLSNHTAENPASLATIDSRVSQAYDLAAGFQLLEEFKHIVESGRG